MSSDRLYVIVFTLVIINVVALFTFGLAAGCWGYYLHLSDAPTFFNLFLTAETRL